ncbi:MAG: 4-hydroxy-tetrahydrodipicolinate synthase [Dongiaceae bacterium]
MQKFHGSMTALITPFAGDKIDEAAFAKLAERQLKGGTEGLIPCGTTGESPTLSDAEQERLIQITVEIAAKRAPVIAGTGSNSTSHALHLTKAAQKAGADAALIVTPYYNKPTQEGLFQHYKAIHDATNIPIIIYNIPPRSIIDMSVETMARLAKLPRIVGVKDATADLVRPLRTKLACGDKFIQLSGEDATVVPFLAQGGHGCISVTSNIVPDLCAELHNAWQNDECEKVEKINEKLLPLHQALFCETSPGPVKYAAELLGLCKATTRLPMWEIADGSKLKVREALQGLGLV